MIGVRDTLASVDVAERLANRDLHDEIGQREDDFSNQHPTSNQHPATLPGEPRERAEEDGVQKSRAACSFSSGADRTPRAGRRARHSW